MLGLILVAAGSLFFIAPGSAAAAWIVRLWPVFLICAGVARIMGFAVERKPRTPIGGLLLVTVGALFLASRFHPDLNAIEIYGRYWVLLLIAFGAVEVVRHYSHRPGYGQPPKLFTMGRLLIVLAILVSGIVAGRVGRNQSLLSALHVDGLLGGVRDSLVGQSYVFADQAVTPQLRPGQKVTVDNRYGSVKVSGGGSILRATLVKKVNAWDEEEARRTAQQIKLVVLENDNALTITTNRAELDGRFTTDIQVDLPSWTQLDVSDSFGSVSVNNLESDVSARVSHGDVNLSRIDGDVLADLSYSDLNVSDITGNVKASGFKRAYATNVNGAVDFSGRNGSVELHRIDGVVRVEAPRSRISCQDLNSGASLKTERGVIEVTGVGELSVEAPGSEVRAANVRGDAQVNSSRGNIKISSVAGRLEINAEDAAVTAENIQGEASVQTSRGEVLIRGFREGARILTSYRDVTLVPACEPSGDIEVTNSHGGIKLVLPAASRFLLDAASEGGRVRSSGFNWLSSDGESINFSFGANRPTIKLRTSYKDVWVQAGGPGAVEANALAN